MIELNKCYNLDCIEGMKLLDNESVDMVLTDPPYDVDYNKKSESLCLIGKARGKLGKAWGKQINRDKDYIEFNVDYNLFAKNLFRICKNNSHIYIFCSAKQLKSWIQTMEDNGFKFVQLLIWEKNTSSFDLTYGHKFKENKEQILFFQKGWKKLILNSKNPVNILSIMKFSAQSHNDFHPCERPMKLLYHLIELSSKENDIILDCFAGSGNHLLASQQKKRRFIGFELSKHYYDTICKRLSQEVYLDKYIQNKQQEKQKGEDWLSS